jgi:hypothetical protein
VDAHSCGRGGRAVRRLYGLAPRIRDDAGRAHGGGYGGKKRRTQGGGDSSEACGKTTIYEYYQSEINKWEKRLLAAGVKPEVYCTGTPFKYCWVRFDTNLLNGVGYGDRGFNYIGDDKADILANGTRLNFKDVYSLHYALTRGNFNHSLDNDGQKNLIRKASEAQKERDALAIILFFANGEEKACAGAAHALMEAGVSAIEGGKTDIYPSPPTLSRTRAAFRGLPITSKPAIYRAVRCCLIEQ